MDNGFYYIAWDRERTSEIVPSVGILHSVSDVSVNDFATIEQVTAVDFLL
jgi:hypothetical protein